MMRVITGRAKGIKLYAPDGLQTRPTSERAKEGLFSMIQFDIEGRKVLDLYAGTGQLGIEALSRGAARAVFVDKSKDASGVIKKNLVKTGLEQSGKVICGDVDAFLKADSEKYDIVFIDPPYDLRAVPATLESLLENKLLKPTSVVVCESREKDVLDGYDGLDKYFEVIKKAVYGIANITIFKMRTEDR